VGISLPGNLFLRQEAFDVIRSRWLPLVILALVWMDTACAKPLSPWSRATIDPTPGWRVEEQCGYQDCTKVDVIVGPEVTVWVEAWNAERQRNPSQRFFISVDLRTRPDIAYEFDLSRIAIHFDNGTHLPPITCECRLAAPHNSVAWNPCNGLTP